MTATLLDEVGIERFNTNLLAERAGVRVRTVYRYFPNKYAVIVALTKKLTVQWDEFLGDFYAGMADPTRDWRVVMRDSNLQWLQRARSVPGALSVLQAVNATPELNALHFQVFEEMSKKLADALKARGLQHAPSKLLAIARTIVIAVNSRTEIYLRLKGREAKEFWDEVTLSEEAYLEKYLSPLRPGAAGRGHGPSGRSRPRRSAEAGAASVPMHGRRPR